MRNSNFLEKRVQFLADNIGRLFSSEKISDFLKSQHVKIAPGVIQNYTEYLRNAFIIHEVNRFDMIGKRIFESGNKFYFENTDIRNVITGYNVRDLGKLLENVVYNHLLFLGFKIKVGRINTQEIDFICTRVEKCSTCR